MRIISIVLLFSLLAFAPVTARDAKHRHCYSICCHCDSDGKCFDFHNGTITITHKGEKPEVVEITKDHRLYVDGELVKTDREQQILVEDFYDSVIELIDEAKKIGWEGAKIGVAGANIGLKAVGGVFKLLFTSYSSDDFERDIEREANKVEARADKLEAKANRIEGLADQLEQKYEAMEHAIPELRGSI